LSTSVALGVGAAMRLALGQLQYICPLLARFQNDKTRTN
jgi:hypothetical protein